MIKTTSLFEETNLNQFICQFWFTGNLLETVEVYALYALYMLFTRSPISDQYGEYGRLTKREKRDRTEGRRRRYADCGLGNRHDIVILKYEHDGLESLAAIGTVSLNDFMHSNAERGLFRGNVIYCRIDGVFDF